MSRRNDILTEIERRKVSAIVRSDDGQLATDAMEAAVAGGFRMVEFTLTTPNALESIARFAKRDDLLVGAGTVLTTQQVHAAVDAGARFIVSPVCDPEVIAEAARLDVVSVPGTRTPTEMMNAHRYGADILKLFPAPADVIDFLRAVRGPLPQLRIFPTAGVDADNFVDVLGAGAFGVGFVRSLFTPADMAARDFTAIERRAATISERLNTVRSD